MSEENQQTEEKPRFSREELALVVEEMALAYPYGAQKYTDEDVAPILRGVGDLTLGALRFAHTLVQTWAGSPLIPKWVANSPNPAGTWVAGLIRSKELGFKPLEGMGALFLSPDGRIGMYGASMIALMRRSGFSLKFSDVLDAKTQEIIGVVVYGKRPGPDGDEYESRFTRADAMRAQLKGQHERYPLWMCKWRAVGDLFRTLAADLSGGPLYTTEELQEEMDEQKPERIAEPEQRREARAQVLDTKITELRKAQPVEPVVVEEDNETEVPTSENVEAAPDEIDDGPEPTLFDDGEAQEEPPAWAVDLRRMHDKLMELGRQGFIKDTLQKFGLTEIGEATEENSMGIIADFDENLSTRQVKPKDTPKGRLKL